MALITREKMLSSASIILAASVPSTVPLCYVFMDKKCEHEKITTLFYKVTCMSVILHCHFILDLVSISLEHSSVVILVNNQCV